MAFQHEITSEKIVVNKIFSTLWFRIPEYQRPYIWSQDEINDLLDDLTFAHRTKPDQEYFLGSFVFQIRPAHSDSDQQFTENDLLDGQQRMTTLLMLFACIRDLCDDSEVRETCDSYIFQKGNRIQRVPERTRIVFAIRESSQQFLDEFIKGDSGTNREDEILRISEKSEDASVRNMATAVLEMRKYLENIKEALRLDEFVSFLCNNVLMIFVATEGLDDAFRLFTILNNRGVPLRNSDILKSQNLGALDKDSEKKRCAKLWEDAEGELGDDFDRFLNHLRTILVKEKARLSLLDEFEQKIYTPRAIDKATNLPKPALLTKGIRTFQFLERYLGYYNTLFGGDNSVETSQDFLFDNLVKVMLTGLPSTDWIPPLMLYFSRFRYDRIVQYIELLDNKISADWIAQNTPTDRIENMNEVLRVVEAAKSVDQILSSGCFRFESDAFNRNIETAVYGRRFTRYLLLKLDFLFQDHQQRMNLEFLSVEHILPQNPADDSQWNNDFSEEERDHWTDLLGNLVLITTKKNTSQGRLDFSDKKTKYFQNRITTCPNSIRVLQSTRWGKKDLERNQLLVLEKLRQHYRS